MLQAMLQLIRRYSFAVILVALIASLSNCKKLDPEYSKLSELGADTTAYIVPGEAGSVDVNVFSNEQFIVSIPDSLNWLSTQVTSLRGDTTFQVNYTENPQFARKGIVVLFAKSSNRYDTITIKQRGTLTPELIFPVINTSVLGNGGKITAKLTTNVPMEHVDIQIIYPIEEDQEVADSPTWVHDDFKYDASKQEFTFTVAANPDQDALRSAQIRLSYVDGWGDQNVSTLYLLQANAQNLFGTKTTFPEIRLWEGAKITSDVFIEGYIVSDKGNNNVGDNIQTTPTKIDYSQKEKTAYVQSVDGKYGFQISTATIDDNVFKRFSKVQILLKGTTVEKASNPDRYTISGVTSSMVMSQTQGSMADLPVKAKYYSALTDDDIYTYVTLKDCELPIRKGPLTPINEGYGILFNASRITKFPLLMRDKQGSSMFLLTNMDVPDRRDGSILPQGSGDVSGIIVHETFTRFNDLDAVNPDDNGNIGRYQIRWLKKSEIKLKKEVTDGFSALLVEYQYPNISSGDAFPTNGSNGRLYASNDVNVSATTSYYYLGLCGADHLGNNNSWGTGVLLNGSKQNTSTTTNNTGKGETSGDGIAATTTWWNYNKDRGEAFILEFSTTGISTDELSLQFSALNWAAKNCPRYWAVEWSEQGDMDGQWTPISKYTVPDVVAWSNTLTSQLPGYKNINVKLPLAMLGKSKVYIRLVVDKNLSSDSYAYANVPIEGSGRSAIGYLAVRYNK